MKKDRNSFFSEYSMNSVNNMQPMMPYPNQVASQSSFYSGPAMDMNYNNIYNNNNNYTSDIESRISKIERQINRIEARLNKLEGETFNNSKDIGDTYNTNMYMV